MKVGIIGGGAMGVGLAKLLGDAGHEVRVLASGESSAAALRAGASVTAGGATETVGFDAVADPRALAGRPAVFVFVKSPDTAAAASSLSGAIDPGAIVVTLQNGLGNAEVLRAALPGNPLVSGSTAIGANRTAGGEYRIAGIGETVIGGDATACEVIVTLLRSAGLPVRVSGDAELVAWEKVIVNAAINPLAAIAGVPNGSLQGSAAMVAAQEAVVAESCTVARAAGFAIDCSAALVRVRDTCQATAANICSMLQDLRADRRTEIGAINGAIARQGRRLGVPTPANDVLVALVTALEARAR